jgi:hypothetical protein
VHVCSLYAYIMTFMVHTLPSLVKIIFLGKYSYGCNANQGASLNATIVVVPPRYQGKLLSCHSINQGKEEGAIFAKLSKEARKVQLLLSFHPRSQGKHIYYYHPATRAKERTTITVKPHKESR